MTLSPENSIEFLDKILARKREELEQSKRLVPPMEVINQAIQTPRPKGFRRFLEVGTGPKIIAEIKRKSPSKGDIFPDLDAAEIAEIYESGGAAAISVLTDGPGFGGSLEDLRVVRKAVSLPLLMKDFIVDPYQIWEARLNGADAVLLIAAALSSEEMADMIDMAKEIGLDALVEVHNESELNRVLEINPPLIGINNRNLRTFRVDTNTAIKLNKRIPEDTTVVVESGIKGRDDIRMYMEHGFRAFLIGETLMKAENIKRELEDMLI